MSQALTLSDVQKVYPNAPDSARCYTYPLAGITPIGVAEWQQFDRKVYLHSRAATWVAGLPARRPERGWPLFASDKWGTHGVFLVATEREASSLIQMGLDATTWIGEAMDMKDSDWTALDRINVFVWMDETMCRKASAHLWRHCYVPKANGSVFDWLKLAWTRLNGDRDKIREEALWIAMDHVV